MTSTEPLVVFIIAAILVPAMILGGMTSAYFLSKRQVDTTPTGSLRSAHDAESTARALTQH